MSSAAVAPSAPPTNTRLFAVLAAAFLGWMFDGMEMGLFPLLPWPALLQMQTAHGLTMNDAFVAQWMGHAIAAFSLGAAGGGVVFALGSATRSVASAPWPRAFSSTPSSPGSSTSPKSRGTSAPPASSPRSAWAARRSLGIALVMEVWPEKHRPLMAGVIGAAANVGFALIAVFAIFFKVTIESWRWVAPIGAAPALLTFAFRIFVPESEKWHAAV